MPKKVIIGLTFLLQRGGLMKLNSYLNDLLQSSEQAMKKLKADQAYCFEVYSQMRHHISNCLQTKDYAAILDLSEYFTNPEKNKQFHYSSESRRILVLLDFLSKELTIGKTPFISSTTNFQSFMKQYTQTVFSFRRLELAICDDNATQNAIAYLNTVPLSIFSAITIIDNEYFENYERLYMSLYHNISAWSIADKIFWLETLLKHSSSSHIFTTLATLYLEANIPEKAYSYLCMIPSPNMEITNLINILKEKIM